jgi:hypothetical protein
MIQVIQPERTSSQILGETLGQSLSQGLSGAMDDFRQRQTQTMTAKALGSFAGLDDNQTQLLSMLPTEFQKYVIDNRVKRQKGRANLPKLLDQELKRYKDRDFSSDEQNKIRERARALFDEQDISEQEAIEAATNEFITSQDQANQPKSALENKLQTNLGTSPKGLLEGLKDTGIGLLKGGRSIVEHLAANSPTNPAFFADLLTGQKPTPLTQFDVITQGKGQPENAVERIVSRYPLGAVGFGGAAAREAALAAGLPEWAQDAADLIGSFAAGGIKLPAGKQKAVGAVLNEAKVTAEKLGKPVEVILGEAAQKSGVDLSKIAEGEAAAINKLKRAVSKEVPEVGKKVTETEKFAFQKEKAMKGRERAVEAIKERPLEKYYENKKPVQHEAPTVVKQQEVIERVTPQINAKNKELIESERSLSQFKEARKTALPENRARLDSNIKHAEDIHIPRLKNEIEDLKYELKNFRKRLSDQQILEEVTKSGQKFAEEAKNPTEKGQKAIQRQIDLDREYVERAAEIAKKSKLAGEIKPDTFIKMKQAYLDGYNALVKNLREEIRDLKGSNNPAILKQIADKHKAIKYLEQRGTRLKADIQNQTDKLKVMSHLEKSSGAFVKQQLKSTRKDILDFQKDWITENQHRVHPEEFKTDVVAQKEFSKSIHRAQEKPTLENISKVAEEAGIPKEEVKKVIDDAKQMGEKGNKPLNEMVKEMGSKVDEIAEKASQNVQTKTGSSPFGRMVKRFLSSYLRQIVGIALTGGTGATIYSGYSSYKKSSEIDSYKEALGNNEKVQRLRLAMKAKGYSDAKINNIAKAARARQQLEK